MSENNNYQAPENSSPIEGWHLTAYALGELDEDTRKIVEAWLIEHPQAQQEVEAIRHTASRIEQELTGLPEGLQLDSARSQKIQEAIASVASANTQLPRLQDHERSINKKIRQRRFVLAMTSGLAVALAGVAFWVSQPRANKNVGFSVNEFDYLTDKNVSLGPGTLEISDAEAEVVEERGLARSKTTERLTERLSDGLAKSPSELGKALATGGQAAGADKAWAEKSERLLQSQEGLKDLAVTPLTTSAGGLSAQGLNRGGMVAGGGSGTSNENLGYARDQGRPGTPQADEAKSTESARYSLGFERDFDKDFPEELAKNVPSRQKIQESKDRASGDRFDAIPETPFSSVAKEPLSTFSIDVDTASYTKLRQYVLENNVVPPAASIRIEEWLNYFDYQYPGPAGDDPFAAHMKMGDCPWNAKHKLVRVAIQAKKVANQERPKSNLVFLIDVSGSMADANKLPLVKRTLGLLTAQLREQDRVAIVVYAGASGCVLPSTSGVQKDQILASINELQSGGSTNGGSGIELAYKIAKENFVAGGVNRVILCTDGDFNVGVTGTDALVSMMQEQAKSNIFLTCLGYGIGNYNDSMMEQISDKGNGTYAMVDSEMEARRVMTEQLSGTLMTVAKDVKIQIEFNPAKVHSYRLIGYENRRLAAADFNNDKKDAGEIGAGHRVTALYEIVPVGQEESIPGAIDELRFSKTQKQEPSPVREDSANTKDWLLLKIRSKQPESTQSTKQEFVLGELASQNAYEGEQSDYDWAISVAEFGLLMRQSQLAPGMDWDKMLARAMDSTAGDAYRRECITIMQRAKALSNR